MASPATPDDDARPARRGSAKSLIFAALQKSELPLQKSELPLSKAEIVARFLANGDTHIREATIGQTLSRMTADGELVKDGTNRYAFAPDDTEQPTIGQEG